MNAKLAALTARAGKRRGPPRRADLQIDRTCCSDFWANQLRVLLTAAAYVLVQELRLPARGTNCARVQVWTLRERLLKLGARVLVDTEHSLGPWFGGSRHEGVQYEA